MGQKVNLREAEYRIIVTELEKMHNEQLEKIRTIIREMEVMVTSKDIFSTLETSMNIINLLNTVSNSVIEVLEQVFQDSEAGVANMIESTMTTDSIKG